MTVSTGITTSSASGTVMISSATSLSLAAPLAVVTAMIGPLRARTCSTLFMFFEKTASSGAMKTDGNSGFTKAMMPCFNSALG
jgi:hypothetical protein